MNRHLVLVHGRAQEFRNADALKKEWIIAWQTGLAQSGLSMPIPLDHIHFPYYGQTLFDLADGASAADAADVIVRGRGGDDAEEQFVRAALEEAAARENITDDDVAAVLDGDDPVIERGASNWKVTRVLASLLDRRVPGASGSTVALVTSDVYKYLRNPGISRLIDGGVMKGFSADHEMVVVAHSLGTVVAYSLLLRAGAAAGWKVRLFATVGSPLAVTVIKRALAPLEHPPVVADWYNARDRADIVALHPLTPAVLPGDACNRPHRSCREPDGQSSRHLRLPERSHGRTANIRGAESTLGFERPISSPWSFLGTAGSHPAGGAHVPAHAVRQRVAQIVAGAFRVFQQPLDDGRIPIGDVRRFPRVALEVEERQRDLPADVPARAAVVASRRRATDTDAAGAASTCRCEPRAVRCPSRSRARRVAPARSADRPGAARCRVRR